MAKFYGTVGYGITKEAPPGVWDEEITERNYSGDVLQFYRRYDASEYVNDDLNVSNRISIVADAFACDHVADMRYICWMGSKWKIHGVDVQRPRLILTIGGVYNEQESET